MKQKLFLFAMVAILLASCATKKKVARAYEAGREAGAVLTEQSMNAKLNQVMDSMANLNKTIIHDTVTKTVNIGGSDKKPTDKPTKDYVYKADFSVANLIGYPELDGKFYRISPIYVDSVRYYDQAKKFYFYKKTEKSFDIYVPIDDYNAIKQKKGTVTIYAVWMKLCGKDMRSFDSKEDGISVLGGTNYSSVGVVIPFKPATVKKDPKSEPDKQVKTDPKKVADTDNSPCPNAPNCAILGKTLNVETCNCD
jgi:hypothetical protein